MSLSNISKRLGKIALLFVFSLLLSGCFKPLYADLNPAQSTYGSSIYVETIDGEIGQILQTELQFLLKTVQDPLGRDLTLKVSPGVSGTGFFVDVDRDRERLGAMTMQARYFLSEAGNTTPLTSGIARSTANYEADSQVIAQQAAQKDASIRAAKIAARIIADRMALALNHTNNSTNTE